MNIYSVNILSVGLSVSRSGYKKQKCKKKKKCAERFRDFFLDFGYNFPNIFNIISKSFATYGCCHPCFIREVLFIP